MTLRTIEPAQHTAAKVAGFLYLFTMATAIFGESYVRGQLIVRGDAVQTARNIAASERLFRIGIAGDLITVVGVVILVWALYVVLKPINWFKSRYIPRALAAWGIFSSLVLAIVTLAIMVFPSLADVMTLAYMVPMFIYEVGLGLWLLVKGIQAPIVADSTAPWRSHASPNQAMQLTKERMKKEL